MRHDHNSRARNFRRHLQGFLADCAEVLRYTRYWILYGICAFAVICAVVGAVENALGR